jgi:SAM-dependent methyltransferase
VEARRKTDLAPAGAPGNEGIEMRIEEPGCNRCEAEIDVIARHLPLDGQRVLELGCGTAAMTRALAARFPTAEFVATEVDAIQHARNLAAEPLAQIAFRADGAQRIDSPDCSFDRVMMFKSLHHVPVDLLDEALAEIARVLRPNGLAWLSEPVFAGAYNEVMRLFHDEREVRASAFASVRRAVDSGLLGLQEQLFFLVPNRFADFAEFEARQINATHTEHRLDARLLERVRAAFSAHLGPNGAEFRQPMRVDLLRKPAA